ncbi:cyclopropane-fatty-acyl-phospholipid synthase family protein [Cypionkella sp.]|uniref:SAM-dependent methyltransferase n=1 Tax=Cypionkella sp. TaxID=2811411 RepID=UPI0027183693|nr:cyclopropane-fatty-acyl-phospholipid synthase family protein [Cypionkella sp.]MDO8985984.1 cyclopropane-fatty-acyl-phospholipid synthase family protein [Cypionkella sp.]MDP2048172.1 cyclopropane-fatty-acyl-phospholipid synthase family protein [Cypionkella sp.]
MPTAPFARFLRRLIRRGNLAVIIGSGPEMAFGNGEGSKVTLHIKDAAAVRRLMLDPELALGESYMDGSLSIDGDDLQGLLAIVVRNYGNGGDLPAAARVLAGLRRIRRRLDQSNPETDARRNVMHHYDLTPAIYDLFLDADRQYSCAYFADPSMSLEAAQAAKKAHIARKLLISPGMRVLDIGCGWGGLALTLARDYGAQVTGITLSQEQLAIARDRAKAEGLTDRVSFELIDYRAMTGQFDRIVSVGMFEHVGAPNFAAYFTIVRDCLREDGVALIHTIGRTAPPNATNPWIAKYIFPGGYVPSLSEVAEAIQDAGLRIGDIECLRLHYAQTLRCWFDRFTAKADTAAALKDQRFVRMWRYYLAASEQTFRHGPQDVFQFQLCRRPDAVPITRDYLYTPLVQSLAKAAE